MRLKWSLFVPRYLRRHARWWLEGSDGFSRSSHHGTQGHDQTRQVDDDLDTFLCNASINFNFLGRPSPPPVSLTATLWSDVRQSDRVQLEGHP